MDFGGLGAGMGAAQANANVDLMSWCVIYCCRFATYFVLVSHGGGIKEPLL